MHPGLIKFEQFLERHNGFFISTHESPDWDGLGAEVALRELLVSMGKEARILNSDPLQDTFRMIDPDEQIEVFRGEESLPENADDFAHIVLDTNVYSNIGKAYPVLRDRVREVFIIDHHEGDKDLVESNFIKVEASSVCEIIFQILEYFNHKPGYTSALGLYSGIVFDTGSFRFSKTSAETFRIASYLTERGVKPHKVYEHIYENNSLASFEIRSLILASMEVLLGGRLVIMKMTPEMLEKSGAPYSEGETTINLPLTVKGVEGSVLIKQDIDNEVVKVSMRSKGDLNVASVAMAYDGGGHRNAAGFRSRRSFDNTYELTKEAMIRLFHERDSQS